MKGEGRSYALFSYSNTRDIILILSKKHTTLNLNNSCSYSFTYVFLWYFNDKVTAEVKFSAPKFLIFHEINLLFW